MTTEKKPSTQELLATIHEQMNLEFNCAMTALDVNPDRAMEHFYSLEWLFGLYDQLVKTGFFTPKNNLHSLKP